MHLRPCHYAMSNHICWYGKLSRNSTGTAPTAGYPRISGVNPCVAFWRYRKRCVSSFFFLINMFAGSRYEQAEVELDDSFTYTAGVGRILGVSRESLDIVSTPQMLSFASSVPSAIALAPWGDAELLTNHWEAVSISAESQPGCAPAGGDAATDSEQVGSLAAF